MEGSESSAYHLTELTETLKYSPWTFRSPPVTISKAKGHWSGLLLHQGNMNKDLRGLSSFPSRGVIRISQKGSDRAKDSQDKPTVQVVVASGGDSGWRGKEAVSPELLWITLDCGNKTSQTEWQTASPPSISIAWGDSHVSQQVPALGTQAAWRTEPSSPEKPG